VTGVVVSVWVMVVGGLSGFFWLFGWWSHGCFSLAPLSFVDAAHNGHISIVSDGGSYIR